ncbi:hypothetical protein L228DRAFT_267618 [Xylona heveae TC161]|uniref:Transcription factor domain-containing protein n=1 Tax=Xylona heveae (strain CBS 132557 / TC161) TaxID=1328760 RepID=A0A165HKA2_XYLHT|nr:hypothetical protein L228DRAFT_267618 [Xylona heveae TC161]KZF23639.1 hypothetical protein L228DRAFT_267618 [Xylona heveae TC161]
MDAPLPGGDSPASPQGPDLLWTPEIEEDIDQWRSTGNFPFTQLQLQAHPPAQNLSVVDLRLIYHVSSISERMQSTGVTKFTIWTEQIPLFLHIASSYEFVMHSILAFSATHLAWITESPETNNIAYQHRGIALKGLHEAIGRFSKENSDAVLAASILLSWQAVDWRGWASLMQGTSTVIDAMQPWRNESNFTAFMDEQATFPKAPASPHSMHSGVSDRAQLQQLGVLGPLFDSLQRLRPYVAGRVEEMRAVDDLSNFISTLGSTLPVTNAEEQFQLLHPLRSWLFWIPISFLNCPKTDLQVMAVLAHFYAAALAVEPLFPAAGVAYFSGLSVGPIEEMHKMLYEMQRAQGPSEDLRIAMTLMEYPYQLAEAFRNRMGWAPHPNHHHHHHQHHARQQPTPAYTSIPNSPYIVHDLRPADYLGGGYNPAYNQSTEHLSVGTASSPHLAPSPGSSSRPHSGYFPPSPMHTATAIYQTGTGARYHSGGQSPSSYFGGYLEEQPALDFPTAPLPPPMHNYTTGFVAQPLWT